MQITIHDRQDSLTAEAREYAERRLRFALSRFAPRIDRVSLVVTDLNGPQGGVDKGCKVTVKMRRLPRVIVSSEEADVKASIARAAARAQRAVSRAIKRVQVFDPGMPHAV